MSLGSRELPCKFDLCSKSYTCLFYILPYRHFCFCLLTLYSVVAVAKFCYTRYTVAMVDVSYTRYTVALVEISYTGYAVVVVEVGYTRYTVALVVKSYAKTHCYFFKSDVSLLIKCRFRRKRKWQSKRR